MATAFEFDHVECAQNHKLKLCKQSKNGKTQNYSRIWSIYCKQSKDHEFMINNISFSLGIFAIYENSIPNVLDRHLRNTISTCPKHPNID